MRKAQAAMEFLITYGWALLALVIIMGTMTYFTGFYTKFVPERCTIAAPFSCVEYKASKDGTITLGIETTAYELSYVNVTLSCDPGATWETLSLVKANTRLNGGVINVSCPISGGIFKSDVSIIYRNNNENVLHESKGSIRIRVE